MLFGLSGSFKMIQPSRLSLYRGQYPSVLCWLASVNILRVTSHLAGPTVPKLWDPPSKSVPHTECSSYHQLSVSPLFNKLTSDRRVNLQLGEPNVDFIIEPASNPPTTLFGKIFVSDVPRAWTYKSYKIEPLTSNAIIE